MTRKRVHLVAGDVDGVVARLAATGPRRLAVNRVLPERSDPGTGVDAVVVEWPRGGDGGPGRPGEPVLAVDEVVLRGAAWLDARWRDGGDRYKHVALATRSPGLTPAEFAARWRAHAGTATPSSGGPAVAVPEEARGRAYVQDHPVPGAPTAAHDGLNEVWFDDLAALDARRAWFDEHGVGRTDDGLFAPATYLAVVETVVVG
ncbi:MAG: EthD domain-containing protein [Acidimicrobiales bacterium]|nr:EthD domain-containing protein [Acidimicrobiales bacterium]